jgi:hypothetical protein
MNSRPGQQIITLTAITLAFGSRAMDVASFTRLGNVLTSVMTGRIVLRGLAAARGSGLADQPRCRVHRRRGQPHVDRTRCQDGGLRRGCGLGRVLPAHIRWAPLAELNLLAGFTLGWEVTGASPAGWAKFALLAVAAAARSGPVSAAGIAEGVEEWWRSSLDWGSS